MPSHELDSPAWLNEFDANTDEQQPAYTPRRSPVSARAGWPTANSAEARLLAERTGTPNEERLHALRLQGVQQQLISLFNAHELSYEEKRDALAYLAEHETDLPRLTRWEKNVRKELERRRASELARRRGLQGVLKPPCTECGDAQGYNAETCGTCLRTTHQNAA